MNYRLWTNDESTVLVRLWDNDELEVATRPERDAVWGPPILMVEEKTDADFERRPFDAVAFEAFCAEPRNQEVVGLILAEIES